MVISEKCNLEGKSGVGSSFHKRGTYTDRRRFMVAVFWEEGELQRGCLMSVGFSFGLIKWELGRKWWL